MIEMNMTRKAFLSLASLASIAGLSACASWPETKPILPEKPSDQHKVDLSEFQSLALNQAGWNFDKENNCYYQLARPYCLNPASKSYMSLSIFVPGAYFDGKKQNDSWVCTPNSTGTVNNFTAQTAPFVMPINSAFFTPQLCPNTYDFEGIRRYIQAGIIYVYAGFRGRSSGFESDKKEVYSGGAPWSVIDLKSAIRYIRYNKSMLPGNTDSLFVYGYGAGATIASVLGSSGASNLYAPYLNAIGAITHDSEGKDISDEVQGAALWCPLLDSAYGNTGYEWSMGQFVEDNSRKTDSWKKLFSTHLAARYAEDINNLGLVDEHNNKLTLAQIDDGSFVEGPYYTHVMDTIAGAATQFLSTTQFPYTQTPSQLIEPCFPGNPNTYHVTSLDNPSSDSSNKDTQKQRSSDKDTSKATKGKGVQEKAQQTPSNMKEEAAASTVSTPDVAGVSHVQGVVFDTPSSYIASLNHDTRWFSYSPSRKIVRISSLWDFVQHCKMPSKAVCAFDAIDKSTPANQFFGIDNESTLHFDPSIVEVLEAHTQEYQAYKDFDLALIDAWKKDVAKTDVLKTTMQGRLDAMNPLYHLLPALQGYKQAQVAPFWRIHTGLAQRATTITNEINLVAALKAYETSPQVEFLPLWDKGFELCEQAGNAQDNVIAWTLSCAQTLAQQENTDTNSSDTTA